MNRLETIDWVSYHGNAFPDFAAWLANIQPLDKRSSLIDAWSEALTDIELRDAKAVTRRMLSGDDPPIAAYEREQTPAKVRLLAKANRDRRTERDRQTMARQRHDTPAARNMEPIAGKLYRHMLALMDANPAMTAKEASAAAREASGTIFPPPSDDGPRYSCLLCLDSGLVTVWSSRSVRAALAGKIDDRANRGTCSAPCKCPEGTKRIWSGNGDPPQAWRGWRSLDAVYSPQVHCVCRGADTDSPDAVAEFNQWVVAALDRYQNRNRSSVLDDFNNQPREF